MQQKKINEMAQQVHFLRVSLEANREEAKKMIRDLEKNLSLSVAQRVQKEMAIEEKMQEMQKNQKKCLPFRWMNVLCPKNPLCMMHLCLRWSGAVSSVLPPPLKMYPPGGGNFPVLPIGGFSVLNTIAANEVGIREVGSSAAGQGGGARMVSPPGCFNYYPDTFAKRPSPKI